MSFYQRHLFFCINIRKSGKKCCGQNQSEQICKYAKQRCKQLNMYGPGKIRISSSSCLGRCSLGPIAVVYPDGVWYSYQTTDDIDEIIEQHLINNKPVSRLKLPDQQQD